MWIFSKVAAASPLAAAAAAYRTTVFTNTFLKSDYSLSDSSNLLTAALSTQDPSSINEYQQVFVNTPFEVGIIFNGRP